MKDPSKRYRQTTFADFLGARSSMGSEGGSTQQCSQDSQKTESVGLQAFPASPSPAPESKKASRTSGTSGPNSYGSSKSVDRKPFSGSKSHPQRLSALSLRLLSLSRFKTAISPEQTSSLNDSLRVTDSITGLGGSIEYKQTWQQRVTPSGSRFWEHTACARRTSGKGCSGELCGWRSPQLRDWHPSGGKYVTEKPYKPQVELGHQAFLVGYNTPRATDGSNGGPNQANGALSADAALVGWPSPNAGGLNDGESIESFQARADALKEKGINGNGAGMPLGVAAKLTGWPTTTSQDTRGYSEDAVQEFIKNGKFAGHNLDLNAASLMAGVTPEPSSVETANTAGYRLNPAFSGNFLMGYPIAWTILGHKALSGASRSRRGKRSKGAG